jgi:hypothetical protein
MSKGIITSLVLAVSLLLTPVAFAGNPNQSGQSSQASQAGQSKKKSCFFKKVKKAVKKTVKKTVKKVKKTSKKVKKSAVKTCDKIQNKVMDTGVAAKKKITGKKCKTFVKGHYTKKGTHVKGHFRKVSKGCCKR